RAMRAITDFLVQWDLQAIRDPQGLLDQGEIPAVRDHPDRRDQLAQLDHPDPQDHPDRQGRQFSSAVTARRYALDLPDQQRLPLRPVVIVHRYALGHPSRRQLPFSPAAAVRRFALDLPDIPAFKEHVGLKVICGKAV
ncbi:MAG: hypothetical protein ABFD91_11665, partial [Anaerohalosphaeraceae bacterium]